MVQVEAAAVNPHRCAPTQRLRQENSFADGGNAHALVLGNDFAGTVCAVGAGVTGLREGDAVFGAKPPSSDGTHATHVTVLAGHVVAQPFLHSG
ncbi:alcohol dehydrogenase catalytic domain-containing protein [Cupriavidus basilensis]